jgi:ubiquinone/menaquinone biosynthesis C-methylase UbiE
VSRQTDTRKVKRNFAEPLAFGAEVPFQGRVRECATLVEPATRLLDVGCPSGWLAPLVLGKVSEYVCLERVLPAPPNASLQISFVSGSALKPPFKDQNFDAVCLFDVIEHLPKGSELTTLREAHRVLRPGGGLYVSTPHASMLHAQ